MLDDYQGLLNYYSFLVALECYLINILIIVILNNKIYMFNFLMGDFNGVIQRRS